MQVFMNSAHSPLCHHCPDTGALYLWGRGRDGQLGRGSGLENTVSAHYVPRRVDYFAGSKAKVCLVSLSRIAGEASCNRALYTGFARSLKLL